MKIKAGLLTLSAGLYSGVLAVDDEGEAVFTEDRHAPQEAEMSGTVTMGDLVDKGLMAEFRTSPAPATHSYYNELVAANALIEKLRSEILDLENHTRNADAAIARRDEKLREVEANNREYRTTNSGLAISIDRLTKERDKAKSELADANASAAYHARNREQGDIAHERECKALIGQRDEAQAEAERLYNILVTAHQSLNYYTGRVDHMDDVLSAISNSSATARQEPPGVRMPMSVAPYKMPKHMQAAIPPGIIGDNDGPWETAGDARPRHTGPGKPWGAC